MICQLIEELLRKKSVLQKDLIIKISSDLGLTLINLDKIQSRYDYNKYIFKYNSLFNENSLEIVIETSFYQSVYPVINHKIESFVERYCEENNIKLPIPFEYTNVYFNVQSLERTFVDKVFAVCDYFIQNMQSRDSRHLYDICKIYPHIIFNEELKSLIKEVRKDRKKFKNNPSAADEYNINELLKEIINCKFYERDYKDVTEKLVYEDISYEYAINNGILKIVNLNIF